MSDDIPPTPDKMKVNDLRKALADRGLDTKGLKQALVQRLFSAIEEDDEALDDTIGESNEDASVEKEDTEEAEDMEDKETMKEVEREAAEEQEDEAERIEAENKELESIKAAELKAFEVKKEAERIASDKKEADAKKESQNEALEAKKAANKREAESKALECSQEAEMKALEVKKEAERIAEEKGNKEENCIFEENIIAQTNMDEGEPEMTENQVDDDDTKIETTKEESKGVFRYTKVVRTVYVRQKDKEHDEDLIDRGKKRKMDDDEEEEVERERGKRQKVENTTNEGESPSSSNNMAKDLDFEVREDEPEIDESLMCLDWYNSDLNLKIGEDMISGQPENKKGWGYAYAGARSTYGFNSGKVCYEVKFTEALDCSLEKEGNRHDLRVGWSTDDASLQLGEDPLSWCYAGAAGKMANNSTFEEYGEKIEQGDIVGAFVDLEGETIKMTFMKNGNNQGEAYQILKSEMGGRSLFPHILAKNVKFEVNFGGMEAWKEPLPGGYIEAAKSDHKVRGKPRIQKREDCELIMMVGLPASGKTTWVNKFIKENPYKNYNIIGTTAILNKMTGEGKPRKEVHEGKWENLIREVTSCTHDILALAAKRRRNIIIDHPNIYPNAQKTNTSRFAGFKKKAVVVVPSEELYKERSKSQEEEGNKNFPEGVVMELKANFVIPSEEDSGFNEVIFIELAREEAEKVVEQDMKETKEKGYGRNKKKKGIARGQLNKRIAGPSGRGGPGWRGRGGGDRGGRFMGSHIFRGAWGPPILSLIHI